MDDWLAQRLAVLDRYIALRDPSHPDHIAGPITWDWEKAAVPPHLRSTYRITMLRRARESGMRVVDDDEGFVMTPVEAPR